MTVNVSATFTKDERKFNGLEAIRDELIKDPLRRHVIVAVVECTSINTSIKDGGIQTPTVRLSMVEAVKGDSAVVAREMLNAVYNERTGQGAPPDTLFDAPPDDGVANEGDGPQ